MTELEARIDHLQTKKDGVELTLRGWEESERCPTVDKMIDILQKDSFRLGVTISKLKDPYSCGL